MVGEITGLDLGSISKKRMRELLEARKEQRRAERKEQRKEIKKRKRRERKRLKKLLKKKRFKRCQQKGCSRKVYNISSRTKEVVACERCLFEIFHGMKKNTYPDYPDDRMKMNAGWFSQANRQYLAQKVLHEAETAEWNRRAKRLGVFERVQVWKRLIDERHWKRKKIYKRMGIHERSD